MYTAKQLPNGNYQIFQNGQLISTGSASTLVNYGLSPSSLSAGTSTSASVAPAAPVQVTQNAPTIAGVTKQLDPGMTDPQVLALQKFLNSQGFSVSTTGPGSPGNETSYFGPATQAALQKYQAANGIVTSGDPKSTGYGRVGPQTLQTIQTAVSTTNNAAGGGNGADSTGITFQPTGNPQLDSVLKGIAGLGTSLISSGYTIPADLEITPDLVSKFLAYAHQNVDPYYQQQLSSEITGINASLSNMKTQYDATQGGILQDFGTNLATEQENAGGAGTAFSGQRNINENNLVNSTNRSLASLDSTTALNAGTALRTGAGDVGAANAGKFVLPTFAGATVSNTGGQRGSSATGSGLNLNYDPSVYKVGNITSAQNSAADTLKNTYLGQYGTLAGAQSASGRSVTDLLGSMGLT